MAANCSTIASTPSRIVGSQPVAVSLVGNALIKVVVAVDGVTLINVLMLSVNPLSSLFDVMVMAGVLLFVPDIALVPAEMVTC